MAEIAMDPRDVTPAGGGTGRERKIPLAARAAVWDMTDGRCWYCGAQTNPFRSFSVDHIEASNRGGRHTIDNLVPCCRSCNSAKNHHDLEAWRKARGNRGFWFESKEASPWVERRLWVIAGFVAWAPRRRSP